MTLEFINISKEVLIGNKNLLDKHDCWYRLGQTNSAKKH